MNWIKKVWAYIKGFDWGYFKTFEPSMLRGFWVAILGFAASIGISIPAGWDERVTAAIGVLVVVVPILQALWTRSAVVPQATHDAAVEQALYTPAPAVPDISHADVANPAIETPTQGPPPVPDSGSQDNGAAVPDVPGIPMADVPAEGSVDVPQDIPGGVPTDVVVSDEPPVAGGAG
jgi:hypothetical protein